MLLRYIVSNFKSIGQPQEFNLLPHANLSQEDYRRMPLKELNVGNSTWRVWQRGMLLGPNGAGKSNFLESICFARDYVVKGQSSGQATMVKQFKADIAELKGRSCFQFVFYVDGQVFDYGFSLDSVQVFEEWLMHVHEDGCNSSPLFVRITDPQGVTKIEAEPELVEGDTQKQELVELLMRTMGPDQKNLLFLNRLFENGIGKAKLVVNWFESIQFIKPSRPTQVLPLVLAEQPNGVENPEPAKEDDEKAEIAQAAETVETAKETKTAKTAATAAELNAQLTAQNSQASTSQPQASANQSQDSDSSLQFNSMFSRIFSSLSVLSQFDLGINRVEGSDTVLDLSELKHDLHLPHDVVSELRKHTSGLFINKDRCYAFAQVAGNTKLRQLRFIHKTGGQLDQLGPSEQSGQQAKIADQPADKKATCTLYFAEESKGTQNIVELLPMILNAGVSNTIYLVDDFDLRLHPKLVEFLIALFTNAAKESFSQLISASHYIQALSLNQFCQGEIWFADLNAQGETRIYPFSAYELKEGQDSFKAYLVGRYGGLPCVGSI